MHEAQMKAKINAYIAEMQALECQKMGMQVRNVVHAEATGSFIYGERAFAELATEYAAIARMLHDLSETEVTSGDNES